MKRYLFFCAVVLCFTQLHAQDIITFRNGDQLKVKVIKVDSFYVLYKSPASVDTLPIEVPRRKVLVINYANGSRQIFHTKRIKEHFLFIGLNENFLTVKNYDEGYGISLGGGSYNESITNLGMTVPGFQLNYISYHQLSPSVSFYNGEGFIFYHNKFTDNIYHTSYTDFDPQAEYAYERDTTVTHINTRALFLHYIVGFRFNLTGNLYFNLAIEPHLIIYTNDNTSLQINQSDYDTLGKVTTRLTIQGPGNDGVISELNINATFGFGYRLCATTPHPLCIEFNFSPNIFNSPLFFESEGRANDNGGGTNAITFHRYTFELSLGYKF